MSNEASGAPGWSVSPGDGTVEGDRLTLMNDVLHAMPAGPGRVTIWFDERPVHAEVTFEAAPGASPPDLVSISGPTPASAPALARALAGALDEE